MNVDFNVKQEGHLALVEPLNSAARMYIEENTDDEAQWWYGSLVVEARYLPGLVSGLLEAGFTLTQSDHGPASLRLVVCDEGYRPVHWHLETSNYALPDRIANMILAGAGSVN